MNRFLSVPTTITSIANIHRGVALPAARVVVIAVPLALIVLYWLVVVRRR